MHRVCAEQLVNWVPKRKNKGSWSNDSLSTESPPGMKEKAPVIILLATTLGLGILLVVQHNSAKANEKNAIELNKKQVKEFEGQIDRLTQNLRGNEKELADQAKEVNSLGGKITASETAIKDAGKELENAEKAHGKALGERDDALKQSQQELLDTKANVAAVEAKLIDKVGELEQKNSELGASKKDHAQALAKLADATAKLTKIGVELEGKNETLVAALKDLEDGQARIAKLETDLQAVNQQVGGLKTQIGSLEQGIESTQKKLAAAVGDRVFLLRELKRMQGEKAELEKHLNNLEYVRAQYKKLKSEWAAGERLRMISEGIGYYGHPKGNVKGVASLRRLARRDEKTVDENTGDTEVGPDQLNVELRSDGTVTIVEPGGKSKVVKPDAKAPELPKPAGKPAPESGQADNPKGVVTPAPESVLPEQEGNPIAPKTDASAEPTSPAKPRSSPVKTGPAALGAESKPGKPAPAPKNPASKPAPANP